MIRDIVKTILTRLTTDVDALRAEHAHLSAMCEHYQHESTALERLHDRAVTERDRLRIIAGNIGPTPAEQAALDMVATMPGALAKEIGRALVVVDGPPPWAANNPEWPHDGFIADAVKPLSSLHKKGLVRREKAGQSYRYWPVT